MPMVHDTTARIHAYPPRASPVDEPCRFLFNDFLLVSFNFLVIPIDCSFWFLISLWLPFDSYWFNSFLKPCWFQLSSFNFLFSLCFLLISFDAYWFPGKFILVTVDVLLNSVDSYWFPFNVLLISFCVPFGLQLICFWVPIDFLVIYTYIYTCLIYIFRLVWSRCTFYLICSAGDWDFCIPGFYV